MHVATISLRSAGGPFWEFVARLTLRSILAQDFELLLFRPLSGAGKGGECRSRADTRFRDRLGPKRAPADIRAHTLFGKVPERGDIIVCQQSRQVVAPAVRQDGRQRIQFCRSLDQVIRLVHHQSMADAGWSLRSVLEKSLPLNSSDALETFDSA